MKLLRVGEVDETVSIGGAILLAFRNSMTSCDSVRVSCVAALGCNKAGELVLCSGKLLVEASVPSPSATPPKTITRISGIALQRRCVLMEGLICFFTLVPL